MMSFNFGPTLLSWAESLGAADVFIGVILLAIIGNAAEHSTAIVVAMKNKVDLSLNIAIGSSVQVALFVAPRQDDPPGDGFTEAT